MRLRSFFVLAVGWVFARGGVGGRSGFARGGVGTCSYKVSRDTLQGLIQISVLQL